MLVSFNSWLFNSIKSVGLIANNVTNDTYPTTWRSQSQVSGKLERTLLVWGGRGILGVDMAFTGGGPGIINSGWKESVSNFDKIFFKVSNGTFHAINCWQQFF